MRSLEEILSLSPRGRAFSNGTAWEIWSGRWCDACVHDIEENCPLVAAAMFGEVVPAEWDRTEHHEYRCIEFEPREEETT